MKPQLPTAHQMCSVFKRMSASAIVHAPAFRLSQAESLLLVDNNLKRISNIQPFFYH